MLLTLDNLLPSHSVPPRRHPDQGVGVLQQRVSASQLLSPGTHKYLS